MNPWIARNLIAPLHERILGRKTFRYRRELNCTQWCTPEGLRAMQAEKLTRLFSLAAHYCSYYRELFEACGVDPERDDPFTALSHLPLLDKTTIRANRARMTNRHVPGGVYTSQTGGSTGQPLIFHYDRRRAAYDQAARMRAQQWFDVLPGDRRVWLWGAPTELRKQDHLRRWRDRLTNELLLSAFNLSPPMMRKYLDRIERFNPTTIYGYPSSVSLLCEFGRSISRIVRPPNLRTVFVSGEVLDDHQRKTISDYFQVPVVNDYGTREAGFLAHECPAGRMHVMAEYAVVEIVSPDGNPSPIGEPGEIVVTHLDAHAMPLIRYRTEDMGRLIAGACSCGRGLPLMDVVAGRRTDHLVATDGTLKHALSVIYVLRELDSVRRFHVCQKADRDIDIRIVPEKRFTERDRQRLELGVRRQLGQDIPMRVRLVDRIEAQPSGKYRCVTSEAVDRVRCATDNGENSARPGERSHAEVTR